VTAIDKRDSFIQGMITMHSADDSVLAMALREHDKDCEFAAERIAPNLRDLSRTAANNLCGMSVRSRYMAIWVLREVEALSSDQWREIAAEVVKYAACRAQLASSKEAHR